MVHQIAVAVNDGKARRDVFEAGVEDFIAAGETMGIDPKIVDRLIGKYVRLHPRMSEFIGQSFLDEELKNRYNELICERMSRING